MSLYDALNAIVTDEKLFSGQKRVAVLKAIAESRCPVKLKSKKFTEDELAKRRQRCIKRGISRYWFEFIVRKESIQAGDAEVQIKGKDISLKKVE